MYVVTGNDDVFALNAKTGEILWERWSGIDQKISTVCCGWVNRGLAMGEGMLFLGQLDANVVALDIKTGKEVWKTPIEEWQNGYGITSAPLYYDGIVYSGITGGEYRRARPADRARRQDRQDPVAVVHAARARRGRQPTPGRPAPTIAMRGGATIWNTPALDPRARARLLRRRQLRTGLRRLDARGRQSVLRLDRGARRPRPASMSGTSSRCITTSGTMTRRARSCCSTR